MARFEEAGGIFWIPIRRQLARCLLSGLQYPPKKRKHLLGANKNNIRKPKNNLLPGGVDRRRVCHLRFLSHSTQMQCFRPFRLCAELVIQRPLHLQSPTIIDPQGPLWESTMFLCGPLSTRSRSKRWVEEKTCSLPMGRLLEGGGTQHLDIVLGLVRVAAGYVLGPKHDIIRGTSRNWHGSRVRPLFGIRMYGWKWLKQIDTVIRHRSHAIHGKPGKDVPRTTVPGMPWVVSCMGLGNDHRRRPTTYPASGPSGVSRSKNTHSDPKAADPLTKKHRLIVTGLLEISKNG